jgi:glycosyltransferase involved in cell wall biosynthesis
MNARKIAFFIPNLDGGGAERVMINLANGMSDLSDTSVDFVVTQKTGPLIKNISDKVNLINLNSSRIATSVYPLVSYIRKEQPDAMISALNTANIIAIAAKILSGKTTTLIVTEHNTLSVTSNNPSLNRARLIPWLISKLYHRANGIVAVSKGVADDLSHVTSIARNQIEVIYNPVITPEVRILSEKPCSDEWITDKSTPVLLGIGRLSRQKNFSNLLKAMSIVLKTKKAKLIILGEGELREDLQSLINELDLSHYVRLPGFVSNPYTYIRNADVFVLSSLWEGLPTVLIEALYNNTKLVSTNCPSGPDEILDQGRYGTLVKTDSPEDLAKGILNALTTDSPDIPVECWERYTLEYSIKHYLSYIAEKNCHRDH